MKDNFINLVKPLLPKTDYCSFRFVSKYTNIISATRGVVEPVITSEDDGLMVTIFHNGGFGYGATSNLTQQGILQAVESAKEWADFSKNKLTYRPNLSKLKNQTGSYYTEEEDNWSKVSMKDKADYLLSVNKALKSQPTISNWGASMRFNKIETLFMDTNDSHVRQKISYLLPQIIASAEHKKEIQTRTFGGHAHARQIGYDFIDQINMVQKAKILAEEAVELSKSPNCSDKITNAVIAPDQMILQIHESIGHPLELDRILGDERNYAGSSFVTPEMFGKYQYGSKLLNITFNPTLESELASYNYDDDGTNAEKKYLIKDGLLVRPIGGLFSSQRLDLDHVACSRASNWNRPPIDRMGNINLEPGEDSFEDIISSVEDGIYLQTNNSWSIDDKRNKFQFGCEKGTLIKNGKFAGVVKNPSYRGITESFWQNLSKVGNSESNNILGTSNCGKGEPNQTIFVGHSTPACLFENVDVFGGV
ncbi:MAG: TldD/PmbA family protein [Gammaproteobacteria bacterium]|nr:TldD/PmbA family protein [Gammaproteobacteria bacterium]|tara:strand:+ start:15404 stop:16837 length:1434 start_codon:yes stop_codon:yes gene_type:complete